MKLVFNRSLTGKCFSGNKFRTIINWRLRSSHLRACVSERVIHRVAVHIHRDPDVPVAHSALLNADRGSKLIQPCAIAMARKCVSMSLVGWNVRENYEHRHFPQSIATGRIVEFRRGVGEHEKGRIVTRRHLAGHRSSIARMICSAQPTGGTDGEDRRRNPRRGVVLRRFSLRQPRRSWSTKSCAATLQASSRLSML